MAFERLGAQNHRFTVTATRRMRCPQGLPTLEKNQALEPDSRETTTRAQTLEDEIRETLVAAGVVSTAIPHLSGNLEDLASLDISAEAGFILSRINGTYDVGTIQKISPIRTLETAVVLWKLLAAGHIYFKKH